MRVDHWILIIFHNRGAELIPGYIFAIFFNRLHYYEVLTKVLQIVIGWKENLMLINCLAACEAIYKHQILFPSIQHLAWLPQGKQKCGLWYVKTAIFFTCGSNNWETVEDRWVHAARVWQALNCLSIHATYCVIITGASPGETKIWAAIRENCIPSDLF